MIMDKAAAHDDLEALVLVHQDAEIVDPDFCASCEALADPDVGVVGCVGARRRAQHRLVGGFGHLGVVHPPLRRARRRRPAGFSWNDRERPPYARTGEVDMVDGFVLVLSPWVVRNLRFDESLGPLHGYDFDFCLQVREAGSKVVTADLRVIHHHSLELVSEPETWVEAHMRVAEKWDGRMPGVGDAGGDWRRARAARGGRGGAARALRSSKQLQYDARERELERELDEMTRSIGWRLTEPLRRAEPLRGARAAARRGSVARSARAISALETSAASRRDAGAWRSRESRSATREHARVQQPPEQRVARGALLARRRPRSAGPATRRGGGRGWPRAARAAGCGPSGASSSATAPAHGASSRQTTPSPKNAGTIASRSPSCAATKSSTAVSTPLRGPPSRAAAPRYGQSARADPGSPG